MSDILCVITFKRPQNYQQHVRSSILLKLKGLKYRTWCGNLQHKFFCFWYYCQRMDQTGNRAAVTLTVYYRIKCAATKVLSHVIRVHPPTMSVHTTHLLQGSLWTERGNIRADIAVGLSRHLFQIHISSQLHVLRVYVGGGGGGLKHDLLPCNYNVQYIRTICIELTARAVV